MTSVVELVRSRFGLLAILVLALALVVWFGWLGSGSESQPFTSPLPPTADPSYKISDDLLRLIKLEEERPGEAQRQATREYAFDKEGRIRITIVFDGDKMPVSRSEPVE